MKQNVFHVFMKHILFLKKIMTPGLVWDVGLRTEFLNQDLFFFILYLNKDFYDEYWYGS